MRYIFYIHLFSLISCSHIPGTSIPTPASVHEGWPLYACLPLDEPEQACCYYKRKGDIRAVCTTDAGGSWRLFEQPAPLPTEEPTDESL